MKKTEIFIFTLKINFRSIKRCYGRFCQCAYEEKKPECLGNPRFVLLTCTCTSNEGGKDFLCIGELN